MLKTIVKQRLDPDTKTQVLSGCKTELPSIVTASTEKANSVLEKADFALMNAIQAAQRSFCITDPSMPDNPIVFASQGFLEMSGYSLDEVLGRNCRFLQGPRTDQSQVEILRNGIMNGQDVSVCMLNYKADGTPFYNQIFVAGLRDASHKIINYVGVQVEIKMPAEGQTAESANAMSRIESRDDLTAKSKGRKSKAATASSSSSSNLPMAPPMSTSNSSATLTLNMASTQLNSPRSSVVHIPNQYVPGGRLPSQGSSSRQNPQQGSAGGKLSGFES